MALHRAAQACRAKSVKTQPSETLSRVLKRKALPQRMSDRKGLSGSSRLLQGPFLFAL